MKLLNTVARSGPALLLRAADFRLVWLGEAVSQIGDGLNRVALLWFVYQTQHSALKTSVVGVLQTLPPLLLGPLFGVYLDRVAKKRVLIVVSLVHGALVALLPLLFSLGLLTLFRLYALVFVTSVVATFYGPALTLVVPLVVPNHELRAANALIQSTSTIGVLLGPVVAGVAISAFGAVNVLYLDAATFLFSVGCIWFVPVRESRPIVKGRLGVSQLLQNLQDGIRFMLRKQTGILLLTLVTCLENFGASAFIFLLPALAKQNVSAHSLSIGGFWTAFGTGMFLATLVVASLRDDPKRGLLWFLPAALGLGGAAVAALTRARGWLAPAVLMIVVGFATASLAPVVITLLEESTPEGLRGRVLSTFNAANMAMAMVGMLVFGWAADHVGETPTLIAVGIVMASAGVVLAAISWTASTRRLVMRPYGPENGRASEPRQP
jgi:DHA3 family macrolide efflux protein-like MFS transporter